MSTTTDILRKIRAANRHLEKQGYSSFPFADIAEELCIAMEEVEDAVNSQECREDEDCDHCFIVHELIGPCLSRCRKLCKGQK